MLSKEEQLLEHFNRHFKDQVVYFNGDINKVLSTLEEEAAKVGMDVRYVHIDEDRSAEDSSIKKPEKRETELKQSNRLSVHIEIRGHLQVIRNILNY